MYGHRWLEGRKHWPKDTEFMFYTEGFEVDCPGKDMSELTSFGEWKAKHKDYVPSNWEWDVVKFAHKVFAAADALYDYDAVGVWLDADCVTYADIPEGLIDGYVESDIYLAHFYRTGLYTETGFWAMNCAHPMHKPFLDYWRDWYYNEKYPKLAEWHDCFTLDATIKAFGDKITTDHISPAGSIKAASPAGKYLMERQVSPADFNQYGTRRGNHEVMMRGTFANIRIKNFILKDKAGSVPEGGNTIHYPSKEPMSIYDAAMRYQAENVPLVVFAGAEYGNGSSRDWAAKGTNLLGVRAVIAQSFERIHRSNLVGMGVLPLTFEEGTSWDSLGLKGDETVTIMGLSEGLKPRQKMEIEIKDAKGKVKTVPVLCRIQTLDELEYFQNGGILHYVLRHLAS
jgi:3-isopropylmalate dehydratase small subunit